MTKDNREEAGFFDASVFEAKKSRRSRDSQAVPDRSLKGSSVVCALIGAETASRRWVRYELVRGFEQGKGLLGIRVHSLKTNDSRIDTAGANALDCLGYELNEEKDIIRFKELKDGQWQWFTDLPTMKYSNLPYVLFNQRHILPSVQYLRLRRQ